MQNKVFVVAVSGGIDSVVLLDMISRGSLASFSSEHEVIVAHVDHGIRSSSGQDRVFVEKLASKYGYRYVSTQLSLGAEASEAIARQARYQWLDQVCRDNHADALVTAHHQDDVLETMMINLIRGTGWRGLCSLRSLPSRRRPLLDMSRLQIVTYAIEHELDWCEDETNDDLRYLRNYIRHGFLQSISHRQRLKLLELYKSQSRLAELIDQLAQKAIPARADNGGISRYDLIMLPANVFDEVIMKLIGHQLERKILNQIRHFVCTARPNKQLSWGRYNLKVSGRYLFVSTPDI